MNSLRVRLVLWTVALEAVLLVVVAVILLWFLQTSQTRQIEDTLRLSATELNAVVDVSNNRYQTSDLETANLRARGVMAWILAPDGQIALTVGSAANHPLPHPVPSTGTTAAGTLDDGSTVQSFTTALQEGGEQLGTIVLAFPLAESLRMFDQILLGLAVAIPIALALSAFGGWFLAGRAMSPVAAMTETARQISGADLSRRLNLDLPDDEIGRLARTFDAMLDRLDSAFQRERQFTADVSHELRTPLGFLKTQLSLARSRPRDNAALLQMMAEMEDDVDRMTYLVEQMLTLARIEQGETIKFEPVALDEVLTKVVQQLQPAAQTGQLTLRFAYSAQVNYQVSGHAKQLQQVFTNFIENALKYTPTGGEIAINLNHNWREVTVTIADTGPGIAPQHLPHLFGRFYRADSARTRQTGGFGLGLAISQAIVQAHQGRIAVTSALGEGTTFTVTFPHLKQS